MLVFLYSNNLKEYFRDLENMCLNFVIGLIYKRQFWALRMSLNEDPKKVLGKSGMYSISSEISSHMLILIQTTSKNRVCSIFFTPSRTSISFISFSILENIYAYCDKSLI